MSVFNLILNTALQQVGGSFNGNDDLMTDITRLHLKNIATLLDTDTSTAEPPSLLPKLCGTNQPQLQRELCQSASHFNDFYPEHLAPTSPIKHEQSRAYDSDAEEYVEQKPAASEHSDDDCNELVSHDCSLNVKCKQCLSCEPGKLHEPNSHDSQYNALYLAYMFIMTMSCTPVLVLAEREFNFDYDQVIDGTVSSYDDNSET